MPVPVHGAPAVMSSLTATGKFHGTHPIIAFPALFAGDVEIGKRLRDSVGDGHAETHESQSRLMGHMRMYTSCLFDCATGLSMVRVVKDQAYVLRLMAGTRTHLIPQPDGYVPQGPAPINVRIFHKTVGHILAGSDRRLRRAILLIPIYIADAEARKQKKALEDGKQPIDAVVSAQDCRRVTPGHSDPGENEA